MELELAFNPKVSYVQYQNKMDVLFTATAINDDEFKETVTFKLSSSPRFFDDIECKYESIQPNTSVDLLSLPNFSLKLDPEYISSISEATVCKVSFTAEDKEGNPIGSVNEDVIVQPFNYWSGINMSETIASFVTPNADSLSKIRSKASDILGQWGKARSLEGYQSEDRDRILTIAAALYAALEKENINYVNPPAGFEKSGQRIRIPDEVLTNHEGTCVDLAVTYAAALESVGLNPIIFIVNGHAFAGFWLVDDFSADIINWDNATYTRMFRNKEVRAVECTGFTNTSIVPFDDACQKALLRLEDADNFICAIDIKKARTAIRPLPVKKKVDGEWVIERDEGKQGTTAPDSLGQVYTTVDERPLTKVDRWKRELLDITNKNNMINMKQGSKVIPLLVKDIAHFEDELADGSEYTIYAKPQEWEGTALYNERPFESENYIGNFEQAFNDEIARKKLRTPLTDTEMEKALRSIYRLANKEMDESGCNSLFVSLGVLRWYEGKSTGVPHYAPLILLPIELKKRQQTFAIKKLDEETVFNVTLAEKLRQEYEIEIPNMDPLPADDSGVNVDMILQIVRQKIAGMEGWDVLQGASIGVFSFSQFAMWKDLDNNISVFEENPVVKSLVDGVPYPEEKELITDADPYGLCLTVSADGSQIKAVRASGEGKTFVMHGPPGTGKSQTITNMISNALYQNKTVLFVAEKRAALEVVQKRLEEVGIGNHCLELHSNKTEKTKVIDQLKSSMAKCPPLDETKAQQLLSDIDGVRKKLDVYVTELHKERSFGMSAYEAISRYEEHNVSGAKDLRVDYEGENKPKESNIVDIEEAIRNAHQAFSLVQDADIETLRHVRTKSIIASVTRDVEDMISDLRLKAKEYNVYLDQFRAMGLPIDVNDEHQRDSFITSLLSINEQMSKEKDLPAIETSMKTISDKLLVIVNDLRVYADLGFNLNTQDVSRTLMMVREVQSMISVAVSDESMVEPIHISNMLNDVRKFCSTILGLESDMYEVSKIWRQGIFKLNKSYNLAQEYAAVGKAGLFGKGKAKKAFMDKVTPYLKNPVMTFESLAPTSNTISRIGPDLLAIEFVPIEYSDNPQINQEINSLRNRARMASKAQSIIREYHFDSSDLNKYYQCAVQANKLIPQMKSAQSSWNASVTTFSNYLDSDIDLSNPEVCLPFCDRLSMQLPKLFDWTNWNHYADKVSKHGLSSVIPEIQSGTDLEMLIHSAFRSIYKTFITVVREESEALRMFSSSTFEGFIKKFRELDRAYTQLNRNSLKYRLAMNVPSNMDDSISGTEAYILNKAINSSRMRKSIRTLLSEVPNVLPKLCPCFLMSPQSVSQYITMDYPKFDLVIFDESSQITTSKAVGSLGRARNAVIAGDSKQLPPTSFFQKKVESDDDDQIDVDSFLDDCLALNMPETYLEWHYRSRHESLIAFSNRMFYDSKMLTFPSPNDLETKVGMRYVPGVYERGKRCNPIEAKAVVDEIYRRVMDDRLVNNSIGIIAFSISQQTCIQDMLDDLIKKDTRLFERLNMMPEEMFIKNLETVQGDERDVILFSIGYGPDSSGHVYQNFGPINRDGGQRRLNVAVSRARMEMTVFTSMKYTDITITSTSSKGVKSMREFLRFAENHGRFQDASVDVPGSEGTRILIDIAETLKQNGYASHFNVGTSQFKVDIGVINPDKPSDYLLGLLSDGESYRSSENTRDREYARADVLSRLGWNLMHVWSVDWYFNKQKTLDAILTRLKDLRENAETVIEEVQEIDPNFGLQDVPEEELGRTTFEANTETNAIPYVPADIIAFEGVSPDMATTSMPFIEKYAAEIINAESPINEAYLLKLYCKKVGIKRLSEQKRGLLQPRLRRLFQPEVNEEFVTYWSVNANKGFKTYRVSNDPEINRSVDCVPLIELLNAIEDAVRINGSLNEENAAQAVGRVLGYGRTGAKISEVINSAIKIALDSGRIVEKNGRLLLAD